MCLQHCLAFPACISPTPEQFLGMLVFCQVLIQIQILCCNSWLGNRLGNTGLVFQQKQRQLFDFFFSLIWNLHRIHSFNRLGRWKDQLHTWNLDSSTSPRCQLCNMLCMSHKYIYPFVLHCSCDFSTQWHKHFCEGVFPSFPCVSSGRAWDCYGAHIYNSHQASLA